MAPPPSSSLPLSQKVLQIAQTLQFAWFIGHLTLLSCVARYGLSYLTFNYYSKTALFTYRTAFVSAAVTYGIVVYKSLRARQRSAGKQQISGMVLASDENVQYLAMALVWLFSSQYPLALLPFGVYSIFHILGYTRSTLIPTFMPSNTPATPASGSATTATDAKSSPLATTIGNFVKKNYDASMEIVALLEVALWGRMLLSAILFTKGSWVLFVIYTAFLRARYAQSQFVQGQFRLITARIDAAVGGQNIPPAARQAWGSVKGGAKQFHDMTDLNRYIGGAPAVKKTS